MDSITLSPAEAGVVGLGLAGFASMVAFFAVFGVIFYVLVIIAQWKIFTKAGEKGWKSLIPIYNMYIMFKLFWETKWFWINFGAGMVAILISSIAQTSGSSGAGLVLALLSLAAAIFALVVQIMLDNRMSKSFGHGTAFTVGLVLLPNIFLLILGFNNDKYKRIKD